MKAKKSTKKRTTIKRHNFKEVAAKMKYDPIVFRLPKEPNKAELGVYYYMQLRIYHQLLAIAVSHAEHPITYSKFNAISKLYVDLDNKIKKGIKNNNVALKSDLYKVVASWDKKHETLINKHRRNSIFNVFTKTGTRKMMDGLYDYLNPSLRKIS